MFVKKTSGQSKNIKKTLKIIERLFLLQNFKLSHILEEQTS